MSGNSQSWSLPDFASPTDQLERDLENVEELAEYARMQNLTLADELLTEVIALLVIRGVGP